MVDSQRVDMQKVEILLPADYQNLLLFQLTLPDCEVFLHVCQRVVQIVFVDLLDVSEISKCKT